MKKTLKRRLSLALAAVMAFGSVAFATTVNAAQAGEAAAANSYGLPEKVEDGAILHCWCWSFNTIKENIPQIAAAGFKSVQTSPINKFKEPKSKKTALKSSNDDYGNWWYQYQPVDYTIGNYMLGTEQEFIEMIEEAHKYGVKVVADIVANHCSSDYSAISSNVKNIAGNSTFHKVLQIQDWSNRQQVTQGHLTGLWDFNTQNTKVQQFFVDYISRVLSYGVDGFRFDAMKHVELPDDDASYAGDFWPVVLNNDAEFQYGEILLGADRAADYAKLVKITAEGYGNNLRLALEKKKVTATAAKNYRLTGVDAGKLVTWVESHDTYCNDDNPSQNQYSSWYKLNNEQIQQGWAVIAAQGDTTPLFFARPKGSSAYDPDSSLSSTANFKNKWGDNTIGIDGDGNYYTAEVAAVNKFRNAMVGEDKNLVDVVKGGKVTMIERGNKGAVIVSVADADSNISVASSLPDGTYVDHANGGTFTVANGTLTGTIAAGAVAVLYQEEAPVTEPTTEPVIEPTTPSLPTERPVGDINGDMVFDINDATELQRHLAEFTKADGSPIVDENDPEDFRIADFNGDNVINVNDVTAMQCSLAEFVSLR